MLSEKFSIAILAIATVFSLVSTHEHDFTSHNLTRGEFIQDKDFIASPGLVYGSCHDMATHGSKFSAKCTFVMESSKPVDSADHLRSCDYDLSTKVKPSEYLTLKRVVALSEDKAVLVFESYDTYRYFVLHFDYAEDVRCKGFRVDTGDDFKAMVFAPQDDKFELVSTEGYNQCEDNKRCKVVVDSRGHVHEAARGWLFNDGTELIAVAPMPNKDRLVVDKYDDVIRLSAANYYGISQVMKEYKIEKSDDYSAGRFVSTIHDRVSLCAKAKRSLLCSQYDSSGKKRFETELIYTQFSRLDLLKVHNVPNGGLLLVLASCADGYSDYCEEDSFSFYVTKTDARGKQLGTLRVAKSARVAPEKLHFYENEDGRLCLSHVSNDWRSEDTTVVDVFCFGDEDFNKANEYQGR